MTRIRCCLYNSNTKKKKILIGSTKIFSITQLKNQIFFFFNFYACVTIYIKHQSFLFYSL